MLFHGSKSPPTRHFWSLAIGDRRLKLRADRAARLTALLLFALVARPAMAQPPLPSPLAAESLARTRITMSVEEQTLGTLLDQVLRSVVAGEPPTSETSREPPPSPVRSIWMDRRVDPTTKVSLTVASTPAAQVMLELLRKDNLAMFPLPGVMLVGRSEWVDTAASQLAVGPTTSRDLISVRWPTGSTAAEVLALILASPDSAPGDTDITDLATFRLPNPHDHTRALEVTWLPHDIWPSGKLIHVDRSTAVSLVLAQFDLSLKRGTRLETLMSKTAPADGAPPISRATEMPSGVQAWTETLPAKPFPLTYPAGDSANEIRKRLAGEKPRPSIRASGKQLTILATAATHRLALATHWIAAPAETGGKPGATPKSAVFDLKLVNKAAGDVLRQLAAADGKKIRIEANAELGSQKRINLDGSKKTLKELAEIVAASAGLAIQWNGDEVIVSKP
ncbi:hypothetical protein [Aporhodopirellula aestuarii]|uniref:Secretin/TonB short N-terminal domain-containing protein n=1 Tax=Aporhodopirellula aestuarii TaxID=2950107 RepID=A0ABT0U6N6_9BACT|nr:hypothetical protein [Aporhodopirellula aestuarii]MCM2372467.1 hypothetical protein [Aporhodopirellula aestuarii]